MTVVECNGGRITDCAVVIDNSPYLAALSWLVERYVAWWEDRILERFTFGST